MTTIGYGDVVPVTAQGKLIGTGAIILGYVMFALPAGVIGTGFALKIRENSKIKHHQKKRQVSPIRQPVLNSSLACSFSDSKLLATL